MRARLLQIDHEGIRYVVGVGSFQNGKLAEIFLNANKTGTAAAVNAQDANGSQT